MVYMAFFSSQRHLMMHAVSIADMGELHLLAHRDAVAALLVTLKHQKPVVIFQKPRLGVRTFLLILRGAGFALTTC